VGELFTFLLVVAFIGGIWWLLRGRSAATPTNTGHSSRPTRAAKANTTPQGFHWPGMGDFEFEVVGQSFYQKELSRLTGVQGEKSAEVQCVATLAREDDNKHDPKAVAVLVDGRKVAHLSREDARSYRRRLGAKKLSGATTTCDALVVGEGTRRNGERLMYGIKLDIKSFE